MRSVPVNCCPALSVPSSKALACFVEHQQGSLHVVVLSVSAVCMLSAERHYTKASYILAIMWTVILAGDSCLLSLAL